MVVVILDRVYCVETEQEADFAASLVQDSLDADTLIRPHGQAQSRKRDGKIVSY